MRHTIEMDYCSIDDAFPAAPLAGTSGSSERKRTRKNRHGDVKTIEMPAPASIPVQDALNTPDRTAYKRDAIPGPLKSADTAMEEFAPAPPTQTPAELIIKGDTRRASDENWFGAVGGDEYDYMPYTGNEVREGEYVLQPDFAKTFPKGGDAGLERAAGIPYRGATTMEDQWKPLVRENLGVAAVGAAAGSPELSRQIADILARLDSIEGGSLTAAAAAAPENANMEVLMFTMSGIFVMFLMDVMMRAAVKR